MTSLANPVEEYLKVFHGQGRSMRQIKGELGLTKRNILWYLYNSKNIQDTNPLLHGSGRFKIRVYNYNENSGVRIKKKYTKNVKNVVKETPIVEPEPEPKADSDTVSETDFVII